MISLGQQIKQARQISGYTQTQIANKLGCSVNTVSRWEHDKFEPSQEDIERLEKLLECNLEVNGKKDSSEVVNSLEMQLEDIRLEMIAMQKSKNRIINMFIIVVLVLVSLFVVYTLTLQWIDPNAHNEPIKVVEYYDAEEGGE